MSERTVNYRIEIHDEGPDGLWAEVVDLPGCFAAGDTLDELYECLEESIGLYLSEGDKHVTAKFVPKEKVVREAHKVELCTA